MLQCVVSIPFTRTCLKSGKTGLAYDPIVAHYGLKEFLAMQSESESESSTSNHIVMVPRIG